MSRKDSSRKKRVNGRLKRIRDSTRGSIEVFGTIPKYDFQACPHEPCTRPDKICFSDVRYFLTFLHRRNFTEIHLRADDQNDSFTKFLRRLGITEDDFLEYLKKGIIKGRAFEASRLKEFKHTILGAGKALHGLYVPVDTSQEEAKDIYGIAAIVKNRVKPKAVATVYMNRVFRPFIFGLHLDPIHSYLDTIRSNHRRTLT